MTIEQIEQIEQIIDKVTEEDGFMCDQTKRILNRIKDNNMNKKIKVILSILYTPSFPKHCRGLS